MPRPFRPLTLEEFDALVDRFEFSRRIDEVHMHCTASPRVADYRGEESIVGMWRYHTQSKGWSDIAQHVSIAPDGTIWTGRNWNDRPASALNANGSSSVGPFMFEMIGHFDVGKDVLEGAQRRAAVHVVAKLWDRFALAPSSLVFHRDIPSGKAQGKTCPGTSVRKDDILREAEVELAAIRATRRALSTGWAVVADSPAGARAAVVAAEMGAAAMPGGVVESGPDECPSDGVVASTRGAAEPSRRVAVCVGIDAYPAPDTLYGCVNDSREWRRALERMGFMVRPLANEQATRAAILDAIRAAIRGSRAGDVVVFQFAGHGTRLPDLDGDEREQDGLDEAFLPYDFRTGAYLLDDDFRAVFTELPQGVNLTCFFDCCHSGTITRVLGAPPPPPPPPGTYRRFKRATVEMIDAHRAFRAGLPPVAGTRNATVAGMRSITFSACQDDQYAYEENGKGDFTRMATAVLATGSDLTNHAFMEAVVRAFGATPRQNPRLECADGMRHLALLGALETLGASARPAEVPVAPRTDLAGVSTLLRDLADLIDGRR